MNKRIRSFSQERRVDSKPRPTVRTERNCTLQSGSRVPSHVRRSALLTSVTVSWGLIWDPFGLSSAKTLSSDGPFYQQRERCNGWRALTPGWHTGGWGGEISAALLVKKRNVRQIIWEEPSSGVTSRLGRQHGNAFGAKKKLSVYLMAAAKPVTDVGVMVKSHEGLIEISCCYWFQFADIAKKTTVRPAEVKFNLLALFIAFGGLWLQAYSMVTCRERRPVSVGKLIYTGHLHSSKRAGRIARAETRKPKSTSSAVFPTLMRVP